ncbi:MAG: hypothetical protein WCC90_07810, partial [Methylocella sp.]
GWNDSNANLTNLVEPAFGRFVEILRAEPKPDRGLRALLGRLEELADYGFFDVVESPECLCEFVETLPGGLRCEADRERPLAV